MKPAKNAIPKNIGVIIDGNRRWAKQRGLAPWDGHREGVKRVQDLIENCIALEVMSVTIYTFYVENFKRAPDEVKFLMDLVVETASGLAWKKLQELGVRFRFIGRISMLPDKVQRSIVDLMEKTATHDKITVNFAMAYSGKCELVDACTKVGEMVAQGKIKPANIDEKLFASCLYFDTPIDLIIRTSGENRTSDFLPWQGGYAEWIFYPKLWPDFGKEDLAACFKEYADRERRFGK